ncbi:MAG: lipoprotein insertase outer membrane protein LolB [Roseateles sp.]
MRAAVLCLALGLAGCAQLPREPAPAAATEARLAGRISISVAGDAHQRGTGGAASFELFGGPLSGRLELTSPLGALVARASWQPGQAMLQTPGEERRFDDLDALTRELLGEPVPVAALFDWLQARPWPAAPHQKTADGFEQLGWRIAPRLPSLVAIRLAAPVVTLRARLDGGDEGTP